MIDALIRVSLVGIAILRIDIRVVVASIDTCLSFAEACNRLGITVGPECDLQGRILPAAPAT